MLSRRKFVSSLVGAVAIRNICARVAAAAEGPPPLQTPHAQFIELRPLAVAPALQLERIDGKIVGLDQFRGKAVLLNIWATWCPPCRRELPILEGLQQASAHDPVAIVAVSIDKAGRTAVEPFLNKLKVKALRPYLDPAGRIAKPPAAAAGTPFVLWGMPITYIIDRQGRIAGYITGEVDWMSEPARAFLRHYTNG